MKRGQALPEVSGMWIAVVFGIVLILLIMSAFGAFPGLSKWFQNFFVSPETTSGDHATAQQSINTVVCGINALANGKDKDNCIENFEPESGGPGGTGSGSSGGGGATGDVVSFAVAGNIKAAGEDVNGDSTLECKATTDYAKIIYEPEKGPTITFQFKGGKWGWYINGNWEELNEFRVITLENGGNIGTAHRNIANVIIANALEDSEAGAKIIQGFKNQWIDSISDYDEDEITVKLSDGTEKEFGEDELVIDLEKIADKGYVDKCIVRNFQLPQEVSDAEDWILYYGDPDFIVHWGPFPQDEDTWTFRPDWKVHGLVFLISVIPVTKVVGSTFRFAWAAIKKPGQKVAAKAFMEVFGERAIRIIAGSTKKEFKELVKQFAKEKGKKYVMKQLLKYSLKDIAKSRFTKLGLASIVVKGVALEAGVAALQLSQSMSKKYDSQGNALSLERPYEDSEIFQISSAWKGKPVIVDWEVGKVFNTQKPAHLVSPCYIDYFDLTKNNVECSIYSYNKETGVTQCTDPEYEDPSKDVMECGVLDIKIDRQIKSGMYATITSELNSGDKSLSKVEGDVVKVYMPLLSTDGQQQYLTNTRPHPTKTTKTTKPFQSTTTVVRNYYDVDVYRGSQSIGLAPVENEDTIVMQNGKEYVLHMYWFDDKFSDDLIFDIYPVELCKDNPPLVLFNDIWPGISMFRQLTCQQVNAVTETIQSSDIAKTAEKAWDDETEKIVKVTADSDIKPKEIMPDISTWSETFGVYFEDNWCGTGDPRAQCFRELRTPLTKEMICHYKYEDSWDGMNTCVLDMNFHGTTSQTYGIESDFEFTRDDDTYYAAKFIFLSQEKTILDAAKDNIGFSYLFEDGDVDGYWDSMTASEIDKGLSSLFTDQSMVSVSDLDASNDPQYISMTKCRTQAIVFDFGDGLSDRLNSDKDPNYCLRHQSTFAWIVDTGTTVLSITAVIAATVFAGPLGFWGAWGLVAVGGALEAGGEIYADWEMSWP